MIYNSVYFCVSVLLKKFSLWSSSGLDWEQVASERASGVNLFTSTVIFLLVKYS